MAKKPTGDEIAARKKALRAFIEKHDLSTADICSLINDESIRQISQRTVQCWLAEPDSPSSRNPPEDIADKLDERLRQRAHT